MGFIYKKKPSTNMQLRIFLTSMYYKTTHTGQNGTILVLKKPVCAIY